MDESTQNLARMSKEAVDQGKTALERGLIDVAAMHFRTAASWGDADGMFWLGGLGERHQNYDEAIHWYKLAADAGNEAAVFRVGMVYEIAGNVQAGVPWYERAAEGGERNAMFNLGNYYKDTGDTKVAIAWYSRAAARGDEDAMRLIGALYFREDAVELALPWFERALEAGNYAAATTANTISRALAGDPDGVVFLAWSLEEAGNVEEARRWRDQAIKLGVTDMDRQFAALNEARPRS